MDVSFYSQEAAKVRADVLVVPLFEDWKPKDAAVAHLDRKKEGMGGAFGDLLKQEKFKGQRGQSLLVPTLGRVAPTRVMAVGLGAKNGDAADALRRAAGDAARTARGRGWSRMALLLPDGADEALIAAAAEGGLLGDYKFDKYITREESRGTPVKSLRLLVTAAGTRPSGKQKAAVDRARGACEATALARDLVNEQAAVVTPAYLAKVARDLAKNDAALTCEVFDEKQLEKLGMGMITAVGQGSTSPPRLIHLAYTPKGKAKGQAKGKTSDRKVFLVGKGITFDSGGMSLKPSEFMKDMKCDMAGAAAVIGTMSAISKLAPPFEVHGVVGAAENMLSGASYHLGDVLKSYSGKTVEVMNTDAEGRLVLGDALSWSAKQGATELIDLATLTGACMVALGPYTSAVFSAHDDLAAALIEAGRQAGEDFWRLPLNTALRDKLNSPVADMKNVGSRAGGAITAALFLKEFVEDVTWAHLDIAGPAFLDEEGGHVPRGGTGFGVRTLLQYLTS